MKSNYDLIFIKDNGKAQYRLEYVNMRTRKIVAHEEAGMYSERDTGIPVNNLRSKLKSKKRTIVPSLWINMVQCTDDAYPFVHRRPL